MKKEKINPYIESFQLIKNRLFYDLSFSHIINKARLRKNRDKYHGQKCIIVCNGPSLQKVNFDELEESGIFTIGLNKINLLFDKVKFRPSILVATNEFVIEQNFDFYKSTDIPVFLDYDGVKRAKRKKELAKVKDLFLVHSINIAGIFAKDISMSVCPGYTVTYVAMQIAYHLGFTKVALIGCDHNFASKGAANALVEQKEKEENHFIPNYFAPGSKWHLPDLLGSEFHYQIARDTFQQNGRKLYNCTEGGKLELLERRSLADFIKE